MEKILGIALTIFVIYQVYKLYQKQTDCNYSIKRRYASIKERFFLSGCYYSNTSKFKAYIIPEQYSFDDTYMIRIENVAYIMVVGNKLFISAKTQQVKDNNGKMVYKELVFSPEQINSIGYLKNENTNIVIIDVHEKEENIILIFEEYNEIYLSRLQSFAKLQNIKFCKIIKTNSKYNIYIELINHYNSIPSDHFIYVGERVEV